MSRDDADDIADDLTKLPELRSTPPAGHVVVPVEPTEEMLKAAMDDLGWWVKPYTAPRESGVPVESDMSAGDAAALNEQLMRDIASTYRAMLGALPHNQGGAK